MPMNNTMDTIDTEVEAYRTLRDEADSIDEDPASMNASNYDALVDIGDNTYGVDFEGGYASAEASLREAGAQVNRTRGTRGSLSAGIVSDDLEEMTVSEAVNQGLEENDSQEDVPLDQSPTAGRYGFDNAVRSD